MESVLFIIVAIVTILSAGLMVSNKNAVHSALFLIVNFIGVAFLYLMLEAPFLALVQIAVYAGAIMVLFLFVIMLLGAERTASASTLRRFPWLPPLGLALSAALVLIGYIAISQGNIDEHTPTPRDSTVRFVHIAPQLADVTTETAAVDETGEEGVEAEAEAPAVASRPSVAELPADRVFTLLLDGNLVDEEFVFGEATESITVAAGEHTFTLRLPGTETDVRTVNFTVGVEAHLTVAIAGEYDVDALFVEQPATPSITLLNGFSQYDSISLGDLQNELFNDTRVLIPLVENLPYGGSTSTIQLTPRGEAVEGEPEAAPLAYPAGFPNWVVYQGGLSDTEIDSRVDFINVNPNDATKAPVLFERITILRLTDALDLKANANRLIIVAPERRADGSLRSIVLEYAPVEYAAFGSPQAVGERLFTEYVLPFQLVAVLLLAAMVGVIVITYRGEHVPKPSRTTRRKVSRPLTSVIASQTGADLTSDTPQLPERTETPAGD